MSDYEQAVFISYAWNAESKQMVNQIERSLQERGIRIIRDKRDLGYKGLIGQFMERIGRGTCVIVVISNKYLRSPNCMFELVAIADRKQFRFSLPNEAQWEKDSRARNGFVYPWKDDQRNSIRANRQIRRVFRGSSMRDAVTALRWSSRSGQLPKDTGLPGLRHGFRVAINLEEH